MKTILKQLFILSIFSFVYSCRTTPENNEFENKNISSKTPVSVKINFLGVDFENNNQENDLMSKNNTRGGVIL